MTHNGSLHIMVRSLADISQNQEITVAFDNQDAEIPNYLNCACDQKNCVFIKKEIKELPPLDPSTIPKPTVIVEETTTPTADVKTDMSMLEHGESETEGGSEDSRREKLSREERKLQAYLKQFEKMEKKNDTGKQKHKDGKLCVRTTSVDEVPTPISNSTPQKPCLVK